MRTWILTLALMGPLAVTGCKKSGEPETVTPAPTPTVGWTWGTASYKGGHGGDDVGTLSIPLTLTNNSEHGLIVKSWNVGVNPETGRVCIASAEQIEKTEKGGTLALTLTAECMYSKLPDGESLPIKGTLVYSVNDVETTESIDAKVPFQR